MKNRDYNIPGFVSSNVVVDIKSAVFGPENVVEQIVTLSKAPI